MKMITIFTPTYNRGYILRRCYKSLQKQTSKNFKWQIVDDGSTDNTKDIVNEFIAEGKISIDYYYKKNGGKVSAINTSLELSETELWLCLDSDDYLFSSAVEIIEKEYESIRNIPEICGLFALRSNRDGEPMQGKNIPRSIKYATQFEIRYKYKILPEYVQVYKTDIINQFRYPLFKDEKYMPLSYIQDQIDAKYKFKIIRDPVMVCEYLEDGITKNQKKLVKNNPLSYTEFKRQQICYAPNIKFKIKACITYNTGNILSGNMHILKDSPSKILTILCYPIGVLDWWLRYRKI